MGRLMRRSDAPTRLTEAQIAEISHNKRLVRLKRKRQRALDKIHKMGWTLQTAPKERRGARRLHKYNTFSRQIDTRRKTLYSEHLSYAIQEFHASHDGVEIGRQLNGIKPSEYLAPTVNYQLASRGAIAKIFSEVANVSSQEELFALRIKAVREIASLCHQREEGTNKYSPSQAQRRSGQGQDEDIDDASRPGRAAVDATATTHP